MPATSGTDVTARSATEATTPTGTDGGTVYGVLRLDGLDVALALSALREVVPCPVDLAGLPSAAAGLVGAMNLRTLVLPVLDLRPLLDRPSHRGPDQVVVVVAHRGQVVGLLADQVLGVVRLPSSALLRVSAGDTALLFSHTFRHPSTGHPVSVLDAAALLGRPGLPTVQDASPAPPAASADPTVATGSGARARPSREPGTVVTVVECGPYRLAVDVAAVHTTLHSPTAHRSVLDSALCLGVTIFADREVPVVDPLVLLGLEPLPAGDSRGGLVLELGDGYVVLAVDRLLDLPDLAARDVLPVPAFAFPRPELLAGLTDLPGHGSCLVLDPTTLTAAPELLSLAAVNTCPATAGDPSGPAGTPGATTADPADRSAPDATTARPYLTYSAGVEVATPLEQVTEIMPFPTSVTPTSSGGALLGIVVHRSTAVPVLCLATLLGRPPAAVTAATCLLLVAVDGEQIAFAVDALRGIDNASRTPGHPTPADPGTATAPLHRAPLVQIGQHRLLPELDLEKLAGAARHHPAPVD